jgi:hypothetical protein
MLEDGANPLPRSQAFGLAGGWCLAPARATGPRYDDDRREQAGCHAGLSNTNSSILHLHFPKQRLIAWAGLIERQVSGRGFEIAISSMPSRFISAACMPRNTPWPTERDKRPEEVGGNTKNSFMECHYDTGMRYRRTT